MNDWASRFAKRKFETAFALYEGKCSGAYADAVLILSSAKGMFEIMSNDNVMKQY